MKQTQKKRKLSSDNAEIVPNEAIKRLNRLMMPCYWMGYDEGPNFVMNVDHNGQVFQGRGDSVRLAKPDTARKALRAFVHDENTIKAHQNPIVQLQNLSIDRYWLVYEDGSDCVMGVEHCGHIFQGETSFHYFFECKLYTVIRDTLFQETFFFPC